MGYSIVFVFVCFVHFYAFVLPQAGQATWLCVKIGCSPNATLVHMIFLCCACNLQGQSMSILHLWTYTSLIIIIHPPVESANSHEALAWDLGHVRASDAWDVPRTKSSRWPPETRRHTGKTTCRCQHRCCWSCWAQQGPRPGLGMIPETSKGAFVNMVIVTSLEDPEI